MVFVSSDWKATDAPRVFFEGMRQMLKLLQEERSVVLPVLEHDAYWFHPENLLLAMLSDKNQVVRADAFDKVLRIRHPVHVVSQEVKGRGEKERERERERDRERET